MQKSNRAQAQQLAESLRQNQLEHQDLHITDEQRLQLEAHTFRMSQDMERKAMSALQQKDQDVQCLRQHTDEQKE